MFVYFHPDLLACCKKEYSAKGTRKQGKFEKFCSIIRTFSGFSEIKKLPEKRRENSGSTLKNKEIR